MSDFSQEALVDKFGRRIDYLRLAVTDRCNLRCFYCMPADGINYLPKSHLLTFEEMTRIVNVFSTLGVKKLRITGGEPFMRKDVMHLIAGFNEIEGIEGIHLTTNGLLTLPHVGDFQQYGISSVNLSLDSLDRARFAKITRQDALPAVIDCFHALMDAGIPLKINMVAMAGKNEADIIPMAELAREYPVEVRYIEEMPFKGEKESLGYKRMSQQDILDVLGECFGPLNPVETAANATSSLYSVNGFKGKLGIIAAFSRTFCGSCNRLRLTAQGDLKTCLYGDAAINLKDMVRAGVTDQELEEAIRKSVQAKPVDGFAAEKLRGDSEMLESMSTIGG